MYEAFYGLAKKPFSKTPDPEFLYRGKVHAEALARMLHAVVEREHMVLTGDVGSGKTTLSRALVDELEQDPETAGRVRVVLLINPAMSAAQLLRTVAEKLGLERPPKAKGELYDRLAEHLYAMYERGERPMIMVDEAHLVRDKRVFDELRLLTNIQLDDANLLSLVLIGQSELRARLMKPAMEALRQRVGMAFHLVALDRDEVEAYVSHRLVVAGRATPLFDPEAVTMLWQASAGIPRRLNNLAGNCLLEGFGRSAELIGPEVVRDVVADLELNLGT